MKKIFSRFRRRPPPPPKYTPRPATPAAIDNDDATEAALQQLSPSRGQEGWSALKGVLRAVCNASDVFPPLRSTLAGVLEIMDAVDVRLRVSVYSMLTDDGVLQRVGDAQDGFEDIARRMAGVGRVCVSE